MSGRLRAGVIGAGVFGGYHAAKWATFSDARLAAVLDVDAERAGTLAARYGVQAFADDAEAFLAQVDVVSIASPAVSHGDWALAALRAGKSVYVEKPLAADLDAAEAIVAEGARRDLLVACGFLERAALAAAGLLDVDVVLDLMIHDLDLALLLSAGEPFAVEAEGGADEAMAEVSFDDGLVARIEASRLAVAPGRRLLVVYPSGEVEIDLAAGSLRNATPFDLDPAFGQAPAGADRLATSLAAFLAAVRGEGRPLADGRDGVRALDLGLAVQQALGE
jgi:predicted dehydrogenase